MEGRYLMGINNGGTMFALICNVYEKRKSADVYMAWEAVWLQVAWRSRVCKRAIHYLCVFLKPVVG